MCVDRLLSGQGAADRARAAVSARLLDAEQKNVRLERELDDARARIAELEAVMPPALIGPDCFDRLGMLRAQHVTAEDAAGAASSWRRAFDTDPHLIRDLVRIGGLYAGLPRLYQDGVEVPERIDPIRLGVIQGRREAVLEILAHNLSMDEINQTLEASYED